MNKLIVITSNIAPYRLKWCEELAKFYEVTVVYTKDHDYERDDRWLQKSSNSCKIVKLKNDKDLFDPICFDVISLIRNNRDSLIIFDGYGPKTNLLGLLYCKLTGRKNFVNVDGYPTVREKSLPMEIVKKLVIKYLCTDFFTSGIAAKKHLMSYGAKEERIVIHNLSSISEKQIIDKPLNREEKLALRKTLGIDYEGKIVLGVGRFLPLKRFNDLIKAVIDCKSECELYLLGGKPTDEYLKLAKDRTDIHFIDFVLPEEVDKYYQMADLFVLPSETDVWGLVMNEAMAQGLPVIGSDSVVASHSLVDGNGYIFKTYNVKELSEDIGKCLDDENNKKMALRSLEIIREFNFESMVKFQKPSIDEYFGK